MDDDDGWMVRGVADDVAAIWISSVLMLHWDSG